MAGTASRSLLSCALVLGLAACGGTSTSDRRAPAARPSTTAETTPAETSTYAERQQQRFKADGADGMVAAAGALWVKTDLGHALRIDPATNRITGNVVVDKRTGQSFYCQGIGAVAGSVWSCATRTEGVGLAQIDPDAARVTRVVPVGKVFDQLALPATSRGVWVLTKDGNEVSVVDPVSGEVTSYPLGARCQQLAASGDRVVATSVVDNTVVVVEATTGDVLERLTVSVPRMAALAGSDIWVDSVDGLTRFSHGLADRTVYPGITAGQGGDLFADGEDVWLRGSDGTITRVDAVTGKVLERIVPPDPISGGSLVVAYGSIWTTGSEEGWVIRLREDR
jgi:streptogramin lyase